MTVLDSHLVSLAFVGLFEELRKRHQDPGRGSVAAAAGEGGVGTKPLMEILVSFRLEVSRNMQPTFLL